jgi:hypothetical protein
MALNMWPFNRKDAAMERVLERCNFALARDELATFFRIAAEEGERHGGSYAMKTEFMRGWRVFAEQPNAATGRSWLRAAPEYKTVIESYLVECCPGGKFAR